MIRIGIETYQTTLALPLWEGEGRLLSYGRIGLVLMLSKIPWVHVHADYAPAIGNI